MGGIFNFLLCRDIKDIEVLQKLQKKENGENVLFCVYACDARGYGPKIAQ